MEISNASIGLRVVTNAIIDIYPLGIWPVGTKGTIAQLEIIGDQTAAHIKLDDHFECLNEWDNCLIAWADADDFEVCDARIACFDEA